MGLHDVQLLYLSLMVFGAALVLCAVGMGRAAGICLVASGALWALFWSENMNVELPGFDHRQGLAALVGSGAVVCAVGALITYIGAVRKDIAKSSQKATDNKAKEADSAIHPS
jgi:hypothetical protein